MYFKMTHKKIGSLANSVVKERKNINKMKGKIKALLFFFSSSLLLLFSCEESIEKADAYGNFEATETLISAEAKGKLLLFKVEEGQQLQAGQYIGLIDTVQLHLQRQQLKSRIGAVSSKTQDAQPQIDIFKEQKRNLIRERERVKALLADKAATPKQLDDIEGQIEVVDKQIAAAEKQTNTANKGILGEISPIRASIQQLNDQIRRSYIFNPINGTVLTKLVEPNEIVTVGTPLYKIANLDYLNLRAYITGQQLPHIKIGQEVEVLIDESATTNQSLKGNIVWIANKAEFTPKIVQTKEERVNLVYAIKIKVKNEAGLLKIGMPAEVNLGQR